MLSMAIKLIMLSVISLYVVILSVSISNVVLPSVNLLSVLELTDAMREISLIDIELAYFFTFLMFT